MSEEEESGPVHLIEDFDTGDRFLIYGTAAGARVELKYTGDELWVSQAQMSELFGRDPSVISRHVSNVLEEGELDEGSCLQKMQKTRTGRPTTFYNLDMIISVGYRVSSTQATLFRKWATAVLVRFATKGFVVDVERFKRAPDQDRLTELREIIRDIRADEANVYAEIKRICALCQDYDPQSDEWRVFYRNTQAKLMYAVTNMTPAQLLKGRSNAFAENMGLTVWSGEHVTQKDVIVAKNYLGPTEVKELNRLTDILLSIFEDQLELGRMTTMKAAAALLDKNIRDLGRLLLQSGGPISHDAAVHYVKTQYRHFDERRREARKSQAENDYAALKAAAKGLPRGRGPKK